MASGSPACSRLCSEQPELHQRLTGVVRAAASEPEIARTLREFLTGEVFSRIVDHLVLTTRPSVRTSSAPSSLDLVMARYALGIEPLAAIAPEAVAKAVAPTFQHDLGGKLD